MSHVPPIALLATLALSTAVAAPATAQWSQQKLLAEVPKVGEQFGWGVEFENDTAVIGAPWGGGSARILERDAGGPGAWGQVAELFPQTFGANFGWDVAISGDRVAIGAANEGTNGFVYVHERDEGGPGAWGNVARIPMPGSSCCLLWLDIDGETLVVGAQYWSNVPQPNRGAAHIYEKDTGGPDNWGLTKTIFPEELRGEFGSAVSIDGDTLLVGAWENGIAYFFERDHGGPDNWGLKQQFSESDNFGYSVDVLGDTAVVGDYSAQTVNGFVGGAWIYERDAGGVWTERAALLASDGENGDAFGGETVIHPDEATVFIGATSKTNPAPGSQGAVYTYERHHGGVDAWGESAVHVASNPVGANVFGFSIAVVGAELMVGDVGDDESGATSGAVYIVTTDSPPQSYCTAGISASGCSAQVSAAGIASASDSSGFFLAATGVEGTANGLFYFGVNGRQATPWGNGTSYQCTVPPVQRGGLLNGVGTNGTCDGSFSQDLNARWCATCPKPFQNPGAGAVVDAQLWYRDPQNTSNRKTSLSDAVEFTVYP